MSQSQEFDVWACYVNGRMSWRAVPANGPVEDAPEPENAISHMNRVSAANKRHAVYIVARAYRRAIAYNHKNRNGA